MCIRDSPLAAKVALSDGQMAKNRHPAYLSHMTRETLNAVAILNNTPVHRENYQKFMDEMVYGEKPSFDQAMQKMCIRDRTLYSLLPQEMKDRLVSVVETALADKSPGCKKKAA